MRITTACLLLALPVSLVWACGSSSGGDNSGTGADGSGATAGSVALGGDINGVAGDNTTNGGTLSGGGTTGNGGTMLTAGTAGTGTTQCSDGIDNDMDGLIDGLDPECTGPLDNDEGSFATGIPGDNRDPKWQDCFYDGNSGAGDDGCRYATGCLTGALKPTDPDCKLSAQCIKFCAPLVPNGCDCFGCCTAGTPGNTVDIELVSTCSLDKLDDVKACPRCTKTAACGNTCGTCELCPGKTEADLPPECTPSGSGGAPGAGGAPGSGGQGTGGGPSYTCDGGEQVCGAGLPGCALGTYCSLGCCIQQPPR